MLTRIKCSFELYQVEYLGHVILKEGVAIGNAKTISNFQMANPKNS